MVGRSPERKLHATKKAGTIPSKEIGFQIVRERSPAARSAKQNMRSRVASSI